MSTLRTDDSDASERELLVDDIQRIREVLHICGGADKISSDEEEDDGSEEDEDEPEECEQRPIGAEFKAEALKADGVGNQSLFNTTEQAVSAPTLVSPLQGDNYLLPSQNARNTSADECTFLELQPVNHQSTSSTFSTSHPFNSISYDVDPFTNIPHSSVPIDLPLASDAGCSEATQLMGTEQCYDGNDADIQEDEEEELFFDQHEENDDFEMRIEILKCLSLNRDYQLVVLDELERIELALAKNRENQFGLHQMRASKDEGKPEPQTLIKFGNPYFKDAGGVGPPDNDDTKMKRLNSQVGGYQVKQKAWNDKEKDRLAEGVRMQNLENKLSPILQKIQTLEHKKSKTITNTELQELEDLKAESSRIKNLPKERLLYNLEGIDWDRISNTYVPKRSGFQCRLQWCNCGHPDVNRTPWTKDEDKKLLQLAKDPQNTWVTIAQKLQTKRTPVHCYERYQRSLNKNLLKSKWTPEDDKQLLEVVRVVGLGNWPRVASFLEGRQGDQCLHRYTQTLQMVKKGKWTKDEDELLKKGIEKYGTCWNKVSEVVPSRSGPQCRERWVNALDPKIDKGPWSPVQDQKLLENVEKFGKGNWSKIARALGNRTDNQCWRRWIVLRKDDFLYYRQNTLRKKRELVSNFTGRRQERPELEPEDLDIPDVPVVKKGKPGRIPLPPEVSRERRRLTRAKSREKKRAEKRRAEEEARERSSRKKRQVQHIECDESREDEVDEEGGMADDDDDDEGSMEVSTEENKSSRNRKARNNRTRIQQPHHRVLMKKSQLSKRSEAAQKRQKRQTETAAQEKTVTVSGALGPFSLLLQAFNIDIPTVLQSIQNTSATPSTSASPSGANVSSNAGSTAREGERTAGNQQEVQTSGVSGNQEKQQVQAETNGNSGKPQASSDIDTVVTDSTINSQSNLGQENHQQAQLSSETESCLSGQKRNGNKGDQRCKSTMIGPTVTAQNASITNSGASVVGRVETGRGSNEATSASTTNQTSQRRAPAIPPLPPCYTTLKSFKSLLMLRPQLQRIASMLNSTPGNTTAGSQQCQPSPVAPSGCYSNRVSPVSRITFQTCDKSTIDREQSSGNTERVTEQSEKARSGKDSEATSQTRGNESPSDEDHVVSHECMRSIQPGQEHSVCAGNVGSDESNTTVSDDKILSGSRETKASETTLPSDSTELDGERPQMTERADETSLGQADSSATTLSCAQDIGAQGNTKGIQMMGNDKGLPQGQVKPSEAPMAISDTRAHASSVDNDGQTATKSNEGLNVRCISTRVSAAGVNNAIPTVSGDRLYRNTYEYKMLSSRFNSLFLWPALLSKIPVRLTSSQIGPVFVQRHPPPKGGLGAKVAETLPATRKRRRRVTTKPPAPVNPKRNHPGLAAVRMASSTSFTTPAQQMCTVGQSTAIRTLERQPDADGANEVVFAASQLVSLQGATRSLKESSSSVKRPCNTHTTRRKSVPVKRRKYIIESSNSSSDDDPDDIDFKPASTQRKTTGSGTVRNTRQTCARDRSPTGSATSASCTQDTSAVTAENRNNTIAVTPSGAVIVILSSDSASEAPVSLQAKQSDTAGQQSSPAPNDSNNSPSPSKSSKRKNLRPEKNRGARWRAMLPDDLHDNSDA